MKKTKEELILLILYRKNILIKKVIWLSKKLGGKLIQKKSIKKKWQKVLEIM